MSNQYNVKSLNWKTSEDVYEHYSLDPLYDLFYGGYIDPCNFLEEGSTVQAVNIAMDTIRQYLHVLTENQLLQEM